MYETVTEVTEGIRITAKPAYRQQHSNPEKTCYIFSYRITIENQNEYTVRLLKRHWKVFDSSGEFYEEEGKGKGMGGIQPVLHPGDVYEYDSACSLNTEIGKMVGFFTVERVADKQMIRVRIPEFHLIAPYRFN